MSLRGCPGAQATPIAEDYDPAADPVYKRGGPKHGERDRALPKDPAGSRYVRLRGMPYQATVADVRTLLDGCDVEAVHLVLARALPARSALSACGGNAALSAKVRFSQSTSV